MNPESPDKDVYNVAGPKFWYFSNQPGKTVHGFIHFLSHYLLVNWLITHGRGDFIERVKRNFYVGGIWADNYLYTRKFATYMNVTYYDASYVLDFPLPALSTLRQFSDVGKSFLCC
jgi:hypothetical protein